MSYEKKYLKYKKKYLDLKETSQIGGEKLEKYIGAKDDQLPLSFFFDADYTYTDLKKFIKNYEFGILKTESSNPKLFMKKKTKGKYLLLK